MTMSILAVIQEFCDRTGLARPTIAMASTDDGIRQLRTLANEVLTDITSRGNSWPDLQKEGTFVTLAAELQCTIASAAPYGYKSLIDDTMFNRTQRRPIFGPRNAPRWQEAEALPTTGPLYSYRLWKGNIYMQPAPPAGQSIYFEYESDFAIQGATSPTVATLVYRKRFLYDADVFLLDENLLLAGLRWKWKAEKGLPFGTEKLDYESQLAQAMGSDGTKGEINMGDGSNGDLKPGIFVPLGNWPL